MKQRRLISILLVLCMVVGFLPMNVFASSGNEEPVIVIAGSDFQNTDNDHDAGAAQVTSILERIQAAGYTTADGFLFAGDYDYGYDDSDIGKATLQAAVQDAYGTNMHEVYVEGNHDNLDNSSNDDLVANGTLSPSGANDADAYGVYVIHESDYMWYNNDEATIKNTAAALSDYLDAKVAENYDKPIFVVSHLPLHYNMRTYNDGDGMYANYIFDELNAAGAEGLNIIFLFGHNHSNGWDDYLGGSAIYLEKGDSINIAQASKTAFDVETLNFTYMNAGYVAYYRNVNTGSECDLTMTVFEITDGNVTVKRYSENGVHDLKSIGVRNSYKSETAYDPDTTVYTSPQTITWAANVTVTDPTTDVSVTAPGLTGVTVTAEKKSVEGYTAYVSYDITPEGYTQGHAATVTVPVDTNVFDASRPVVVIDKTLGTTVSRTIVNGTVTFTTDHFSVYDVAQLDATYEGDWIKIPGNGYVYELDTNGIDTGVEYLIVANAYAKALSAAASSDNAVDIEIDGNYAYIDSDAYGWTFTQYNSGVYYIRLNGSDYLTHNKGSLSSANWESDSGRWTVSSNNGGSYHITQTPRKTTYNLRWSNSNGEFQASSSYEGPVRLYKYKGTSESSYAQLSGVTSHEIAINTYANQAAVEAMLRTYITVKAGATDNTGTGAATTTDYSFSGTVDPTTAGDYTLSVTYGGVTLGTVTVKVVAKTATRVTVEPMNGEVQRGASASTVTGSTMTVTYDDGSQETIPVTVGMLSGDLNVKVNGTYTGLTVTYAGQTVTGYTLAVVNVKGNDFPTYPNGGSVDVNKSATGLDFQNTGLARVELSTSGLPAGKGVDVVVVIDTSSSMDDEVDGKNRIEVLSESLEDMLIQFQTANSTTGVVPDVEIAVIDFNGYDTEIDGASLNGTSRGDGSDNARVFTGTNTGLISTVGLSADNFVKSTSLDANAVASQFNLANIKSGTNYDIAMKNAYTLLAAKKAANTEDRAQYVIFLSDGAPFRYNGFNNGSSRGYDQWNNWLTGYWSTVDEVNAVSNNDTYTYFYNGNGDTHPHRIAEAIKGEEDSWYDVVDNTAADKDPAYITQYQGLGAKIYSIGFCLAADGDYSKGHVTVDTMQELIRTISSGAGYYYENVTSASQLTDAFTQIVTEINYAAQNAVFEDQMGSAFDLQMNPTVTDSSGNTRTEDTDITITTHPIYTSAQIGTKVNGYTVTADDVGKTYGDGTVVEKVSFTVDEEGNIAAASTAVTETDGNILNDGVICAKNFFYNTTASAKTITLADGSTYSLPAETFYWNIGTINEKQFTLSYTVYLTGSMEGGAVPNDSYDTNNYAKLCYTNWLGNEVSQSVPSPSMPWGGANVSYAFYLVDSNGNPLLADGTSADNFLQAYKVTQPVLYKTINLNSDETVLSAVAKEVLPTGYTLYDESAVYTVQVNSGDGGGSWTIDYDTSKTQSTYVVGYGSSNDYSKDTSVNEGSYDYTHTTVYFAVVWTVGTVPDAVVIDYGLPVDISVLVNDMFGGNATLAGVGENKPDAIYANALDSNFGSSVATTYGTAKVNGDEVRYTLNISNGMQVAAAETFAYAANYTGATNPGYYYGEVTVIPATMVYYEEDFIAFTDSSAAKDTYGKWSDAGTRDTNATQDEDRPGEYSLGSIDANNVYGYDSAYTSCTTFSNGGAKKVTVDAATGTKNAAPTATFTFTGTGFDVISLTNNQSGAIMVTATNAADGTVYKKTVDDYYGYSYGEYTNEAGETVTGWYVDTESTDTIWQVPVIKMEGMPYGTYNVEIKVTFLNLADHDDDGSYSFWMDAIRIYDPAKNDTTSNQAYDEDKEYAPVYMTLRDLLVGAGDLDTDAEKATGVVFIDGKDATSDIHDYANPGPNNETYLAQGQGVSFKLTSATKPVSAQIGVKLAYGDQATLKLGESDFQTVETASDMYYEMALTWKQNESEMYESNVIVLSNATANAVISLTNIKLTYDAPVSDAQTTAVVDEEVLTAAPMMMRMLYAPVVEEKPDPFVAEYVDATWVGTRAKRTSILSITTSEDVEAVTVNGEEIGTYVTVPKISFENWKFTVTYYRLWIYTDKQATAGIYTYDVIVYNADGLASEPIAAELTVR